MGERFVIVIRDNGKYIASIYDHWGGTYMLKPDFYDKLIECIKNTRKNANGFANFLSMFVHFYREIRGFKPDEGYTIYLHVGDDYPALPDYPILIYDYAKDEFDLAYYDDIDKVIKGEKFRQCFPIFHDSFITYECEKQTEQIVNSTRL